jgi:hypothetical protein
MVEAPPPTTVAKNTDSATKIVLSWALQEALYVDVALPTRPIFAWNDPPDLPPLDAVIVYCHLTI